MKKIDSLFIRLRRGKNEAIGKVPHFTYSLNDFKIDFLENGSVDWEETLTDAIELLSKFHSEIIDDKNKFRTKFNINDESSISPNTQTENLEEPDALDLFSSIDYEVTIEKWVLNHIEIIRECINFYKENKNKPPFNYPVLTDEKVAFWGTQDEFMSLINLLENQGLYFGTPGVDISRKNEYKGKQKKTLIEFQKHVGLKKERVSTFLINYFYTVKIDGDQIVTGALDYGALYKNTNFGAFKDLGKEKRIDMIHFFRRILEKIDPEYKIPTK